MKSLFLLLFCGTLLSCSRPEQKTYSSKNTVIINDTVREIIDTVAVIDDGGNVEFYYSYY